MSNRELLALAERNRPPQSWHDEDFTGLWEEPMLIRHTCGHEVEMADGHYGGDMAGWGECHLCSACLEAATSGGVASERQARRDKFTVAIACALAERYVYGTEAHLDNWAATAVKMADRLILELEKPR